MSRIKAPHLTLSIDRCPVHRQFWAVSLNVVEGEGRGSGKRLTGSKCCGQWEAVRSWPVDAVQLRADIVEEEAWLQRLLARDARKGGERP